MHTVEASDDDIITIAAKIDRVKKFVGPKRRWKGQKKMVLKRIMDYRSRMEKFLGEYDNKYFWKFVVVCICKYSLISHFLFDQVIDVMIRKPTHLL